MTPANGEMSEADLANGVIRMLQARDDYAAKKDGSAEPYLRALMEIVPPLVFRIGRLNQSNDRLLSHVLTLTRDRDLYKRAAEWFAHNAPGTPVPEWVPGEWGRGGE